MNDKIVKYIKDKLFIIEQLVGGVDIPDNKLILLDINDKLRDIADTVIKLETQIDFKKEME